MKKRILIILLIVLSVGFILATDCPPSIPKTYSGTVKYNGNLVLGNYEIRASTSTNDTIGIGNVINGYYSIDVSPCYGTIFSFYIGGIPANEMGNYSGQSDWGVEQNLNLTINTLPTIITTCGNEIVESGEECDGTNLAGRSVNDCGTNWQGTIYCSSTCKIDYSNCAYIGSSGGSGGGGGGSSGGGGGGGGGGSSGSGVVPITTTSTGMSTQTSNEGNKTINLTSEKNQKPTSSGITGGFMGFVKSGGGIATILVLTTIVVLSIAITSMKKKKLTKEQKTKEF